MDECDVVTELLLLLELLLELEELLLDDELESDELELLDDDEVRDAAVDELEVERPPEELELLWLLAELALDFELLLLVSDWAVDDEEEELTEETELDDGQTRYQSPRAIIAPVPVPPVHGIGSKTVPGSGFQYFPPVT